ncbi:carnitine O-acetyltransferase isoform X1 [Hydra vulgaris]|uniref:carnitine O-acetyltransferase isoform X1 n=1 Tax=Hydra vulgaris TaxID=6087 RepID=UPI00019242C0|nr:carnitine O-acetyltransferase [Hydra vulgaris]
MSYIIMKNLTQVRHHSRIMMAMENSLPHLPVPPLHQTMNKYIIALEPLLNKNQLEKTKKLVSEFLVPGGVGEKLQHKLEEKAKVTDNWLADWWNSYAYFEYREPLVIKSNPGFSFPLQHFEQELDQYRFTAKLIRAVVSCKELIDSESIPVEYSRGNPLSMMQYKNILSTCRIPLPDRDTIVFAPPDCSRHMVVVYKNQFFKLNVYDEDGCPLSETHLIQQLFHITSMSLEKDECSVGVLTTQDRNTWAQIWKLLATDSINKENVDCIVNSICLICLDQPVSVEPTQYKYEFSNLIGQMVHGGGTHENSMNRWFDKVCQLIVNRNGMVGLCYEHSAAEGSIVMALCNHVLDMIKNVSMTSEINVSNVKSSLPPLKFKWNLNSDIINEIELAKQHVDQLTKDLELRVFHFDQFGKNVPKSYNLSPDAFFQVSLQLAYFRLHNQHPSTFEAASIRKFAKGRTETIRSATPAAIRFVQAMDNSSKNITEKKELFLNAIEAHVQYTNEALNLQAIDRHLLGLKLTALSTGLPLPEVFCDTAYKNAMYFHLCSSQIASSHMVGVIFAPEVPDGYGVCYNPMETKFIYVVSAYHSDLNTNAGDFGESIARAMEDNYILLINQTF